MDKFTPAFIIDDKQILWNLHAAALDKHLDIDKLVKEGKFINTGIGKDAKSSFNNKEYLYEIAILFSNSIDKINSDLGIFTNIDKLKPEDIENELKNNKEFLDNRKIAFKNIKDYFIIMTGEKNASKLKEQDLRIFQPKYDTKKLSSIDMTKDGKIPEKYDIDMQKASNEFTYGFKITYMIV